MRPLPNNIQFSAVHAKQRWCTITGELWAGEKWWQSIRFCVFGGLCVDTWRLVIGHQWLFFAVWLFLTIGTLLVQSCNVARVSCNVTRNTCNITILYEQCTNRHVYTESAEYTKPSTITCQAQLTRISSRARVSIYEFTVRPTNDDNAHTITYSSTANT